MKRRNTNAEFDPLQLTNEELELHLCCVELAQAPAIADDTSLLRGAQRAQQRLMPIDAIEALREHLLQYKLSFSEHHDIDHHRFILLRKLRKMSQHDLAIAMGVSQATLCGFEKKGNGRLDFVRLLLAAAALAVDPRQFVGPPALDLLPLDDGLRPRRVKQNGDSA